MKLHSILLTVMMALGVLLSTSCRVEKRVHRPGYHVEWHYKKKAPQPKEQILAQISREAVPEESDLVSKVRSELETNTSGEIQTVSNYFAQAIRQEKKIETVCDTMVLVSGERIFGIITEINKEYILYAECVDHYGPYLRVNRSELKEIIYRNGKREETVQLSPYDVEHVEKVDRQMEPIGWISVVFGIMSFFWAPLLFSPLAIVFALISITRISRNREYYGGLAFAFIGLTLGLFTGIILLLVFT